MPRKMPAARSTVSCSVPGYEHISATYDLSARFDKVDAARRQEPKEFIKALGVSFEGWDFVDDDDQPIPVPSAEDTSGLNPILLRWLYYEGYDEAIRQLSRPKG